LTATNRARAGKQKSLRARLQAESLEDRVVLSGAFQNGKTLFINLSGGAYVNISELNPTGNRQIVVGINGQNVQDFSINTINAVDISVAGQNGIFINDSNGMPFATGSTITIQGSGSNNVMDLFGSRAFDTGEVYVVGGTASTNGALLEDGLNFEFSSALSAVTDVIHNTGGPLQVSTSGQNVVLNSGPINEQTLTGLGAGGGSTFTFAEKSSVQLNEFGADATVTLNAPESEALESSLFVGTHALGDDVVIAATSVPTSVQTVGGNSEVVLRTNTSPVSVVGDPTSTMIIGALQSNGGDSTQGVDANVQVQNMRLLLLSNSANVSAAENVTVTQSTVSGTGLFGKSTVDVSYGDVGTVAIFSGQGKDSYTVEASSSTAPFSSQIDLFDDSTVSYSAHVDLDAKSHLSLDLINETTKAGGLFIDAPHGKFSPLSNGVINVTFTGGLASQIDESGFTIKEEHN
jgi:hypothetical protein